MSTNRAGDDDTAAEDEVLVDLGDGIGRITLNQPHRRNPLGLETTPLLLGALDRLEADAACRVIILTGKGPVFCGGADLDRILGDDVDMEWQLQLVRGYNRLIQRMRELDLPLIAAVNGPAVGGGAALAMACDFAVAAPGASYFFAFGRIGASAADMGCTYLLPRHVGAARAAHLILTGATVDAEMGRHLGLFVEVVAEDALLATAEAMARRIIEAYPRRATAISKLGLVRGESAPMESCLAYEALAQNYTFRSEEHRQRLAAFLDGRG
jgi:enoyl-CoA hydratase/carnithine racemase